MNGAPVRFGQPAGDLRLSHAGRADHDDVFRRDLFADLLGQLLPTPAVAQRDGHRSLRIVLADDVLVELGDDFARRHFAHFSSSTTMLSLV